ncbi:MAG: hypothetical protein M0P71_07890 [Melioribacteraceae bacterium]|nr:hypothetical protein [Melioribacteraceae bacterium]
MPFSSSKNIRPLSSTASNPVDSILVKLSPPFFVSYIEAPFRNQPLFSFN